MRLLARRNRNDVHSRRTRVAFRIVRWAFWLAFAITAVVEVFAELDLYDDEHPEDW